MRAWRVLLNYRCRKRRQRRPPACAVVQGEAAGALSVLLVLAVQLLQTQSGMCLGVLLAFL